jgi:hypothetical protein
MANKITLRASASSRWIACPASVRLSEGVPFEPSGEAAQIGTAIHALAEKCFGTGEKADAYLGKQVEGITMTQENVEFAQAHIDHITNLKSELGAVKVEQYVTVIDDADIKLGGTADVIGFGNGILEIADLKTGRVYVDADSSQMKIYALGTLAKIKSKPVETVRLSIIQPHSGDTRTHTMTVDELIQWRNETLLPAIMEASNKDSQPKPSNNACRYCPAKVICPAQTKALELIPVKLDVKTLAPEVVSDLLARSEMVEDFIAALRKHATKVLEDGGVLSGWQLSPKRATRKWIDEAAAVAALEAAGIEHSKLMLTEIISPAVAEKLLGKDKKHVLEDITKKESSGLTLAKAVGLGQ